MSSPEKIPLTSPRDPPSMASACTHLIIQSLENPRYALISKEALSKTEPYRLLCRKPGFICLTATTAKEPKILSYKPIMYIGHGYYMYLCWGD